MADEIGFNLILKSNLGLKYVKLQQVEVVVAIKGDTDPLTIQKIYDHVQPKFLSERKKLNDVISSYDTKISRAKKAADKRGELAVCMKNIDKRITDISNMLKNEVNSFCKEEIKRAKKAEEAEAAARWSTYKLGVKLAWNGRKVAMDSAAACAALFVAPIAYPATVAGAKAIIDLARDIKELWEDITGIWNDEKKQRALVKGYLKQIGKLKSERNLRESQIKQLQKAIDDHMGQLDLIDVKARRASKDLQRMLKAAGNLEGVDPKKLIVVEKGISELIEEIIRLNASLGKGKKFQLKARASLGAARRDAKKDGWTLGYFDELYKMYNDVKDLYWDMGAEAICDQIIKIFTDDDYWLKTTFKDYI